MTIQVKPKTANEVFFDLLSQRRLMPNLSIEREAELLLSRIRYALANSNASEESKVNISEKINYQGPVKCEVQMGLFKELSRPENRNLLLAGIALEVEKSGGNPEYVGLVRSISALSFLSHDFDKAVVLLPTVDVATQLCEPNSDAARKLRDGPKELGCAPA
jgi:hypothetical protein